MGKGVVRWRSPWGRSHWPEVELQGCGEQDAFGSGLLLFAGRCWLQFCSQCCGAMGVSRGRPMRHQHQHKKKSLRGLQLG